MQNIVRQLLGNFRSLAAAVVTNIVIATGRRVQGLTSRVDLTGLKSLLTDMFIPFKVTLTRAPPFYELLKAYTGRIRQILRCQIISYLKKERGVDEPKLGFPGGFSTRRRR
jgi:hypothetical protein